MKKFLFLAVLAVALIASPAMAKEGVYIGAGLVYDKIYGSDLDFYDAAGGLNLKLGYNFGSIALEGNFTDSKHTATGYTDLDLKTFTIDLRVSFSQTNDPNQVYGLVGLGGSSAEAYSPLLGTNVKFTGGVFDIGGGLEHFFNDQVALNLGLIYRFIQYDKAEAGGVTYTVSPEASADTLSILAGLNLYF